MARPAKRNKLPPDRTELMATVDNDDELPPLHQGAPITLSWAADAPFVLQGRSAIVGATTTDVDEVQATIDGKDVGKKDKEVVKDQMHLFMDEVAPHFDGKHNARRAALQAA